MTDIWDYIEAHSDAEPAYLTQVARDTHLYVLNPRMLCGHVEGRLLTMLAKISGARRILELGTFTGYSALCLAESGAEVVTIDHNDELEEVVLRNLSRSPFGRNVHPLIGDALSILPTLALSIQKGETEPFDLVFIDADKRQYTDYLYTILGRPDCVSLSSCANDPSDSNVGKNSTPLVRPGALILADNVLWDGHIIDPAYDHDKQTVALRAFNDAVANDDSLEKVILPLRDGLTLIRLRG